MPLLKISTLGRYSVASEERLITGFESAKVRALLVFLVVESDRPHSRDSLAGLLWPDYPQNSAANSLRNALANLRKVIGDRSVTPPYLHITRETIQFNTASDHWLDAAELKRYFSFPMDKDSEPDSAVISNYRTGISLYHGRFLEDFFLPDSQSFDS